MTSYDPYAHAEQLGIPVRPAVLPYGLGGLWLPEHRTIYLSHDLHPIRARCTCGHEVQHVIRGVKHARGSRELHRVIEAQCDRDAAALLISVEDLADQVASSTDPGEWAANLRVTGRMIRARLRSLTPGERELLDTIHLDP